MLHQAGIGHLVAASQFKTSDYEAMIAEVRPRCPELRTVTIIGSAEWERLAGTDPDGPRLAEAATGLSADDPINIQYTSGTTGFPKGATLSHLEQRVRSSASCAATPTPTAWASQCPLPLLRHDDGEPRLYDARRHHGHPGARLRPAATLAALAEERCTSLYGVPTMFIAELADPGFEGHDLSSLRTGIMADRPAPSRS